MRTIAAVMIVLALGTSGMILGMANFGDAWGAEPPRTNAAAEQLDQSSGQVRPGAGPVGGPVTSGDSNIVGLIVSGIGKLVDIGGAIAVLPLTLMGLHFPAWFAVPVGLLAETIVGIGLIEFATQREWT